MFAARRSGKKAETGDDGRGDDHVGGRKHADDEGGGRNQTVHNPFVLGHQTGPDNRRLPVGVQADGNEKPTGQEGGQVGVGSGTALRGTLVDGRTLSGSGAVRTAAGTRTAAPSAGTAATPRAAAVRVQPVRTAATAGTSVHVIR